MSKHAPEYRNETNVNYVIPIVISADSIEGFPAGRSIKSAARNGLVTSMLEWTNDITRWQPKYPKLHVGQKVALHLGHIINPIDLDQDTGLSVI